MNYCILVVLGIIYSIFLRWFKQIKIKRFDDKFVNGFIAGIIAFLITGPIGLAVKYFELVELDLADFSGLLTLGRIPEGLSEDIFAALVDMMVSGALGIIFAFLVPYIGIRYLLFKGWFILGAAWYIYYPVVTMGIVNKNIDLSVQTHLINGIIAGLFGLVLAQAYNWLHRDTQLKRTSLKGARKNDRVTNAFAEEIASPVDVPAFVPSVMTSPPVAPARLMATPDNWTSTPLFEVTWTNPEHHARIVGAYYKLGMPPTGDTDGIYVSENPFTVTATEKEHHVYVWLQDEHGYVAYQNAAFITLKYAPVEPIWFKNDRLKVTKVMADSVTLEWPSAIDNTGHIKYRILANSVFAGETEDTTFIVSNLEPATSYTFSVVAENEAGKSTQFHRVKKVRTPKVKKEK